MRNASVKYAIMPALIALLCTGSKAADDLRASQLTFERWSKTCISGSPCFVSTEARGTCVPSGGGMLIQTVDGRPAKLSAFVGTRRTLDGDIRVQIDQDSPVFVPAPNCYASGCNGTFEIGDEFVERMKRSSNIAIEATTTAHRRITLSFSLAGFAQAFDGPGAEPRVIEEIISNKEMEERRARAEKTRPPLCEE